MIRNVVSLTEHLMLIDVIGVDTFEIVNFWLKSQNILTSKTRLSFLPENIHQYRHDPLICGFFVRQLFQKPHISGLFRICRLFYKRCQEQCSLKLNSKLPQLLLYSLNGTARPPQFTPQQKSATTKSILIWKYCYSLLAFQTAKYFVMWVSWT